MIPKIIHYCWFGGNAHNELIKKCINSWQKFLPEYKIIEWNESNIDIQNNEFMHFCYQEKKWAYVADYARLIILKEYGGFYLDTDMEVIKPFPESFMKYKFIAGEEVDNQVSCGIIGAIPQNETIARLIEYYDKLILLEPIPVLLNDILIAENKLNDPSYYIPNSEVFYPMKYDGSIGDTKNSFTIHHWEGSWKNEINTFYENFLKNRNNLFNEEEERVLNDLHIKKNITLKMLVKLNALIINNDIPKEIILNLTNKHCRLVKHYIDNRFIDPAMFNLTIFFESIINPYLKDYPIQFYLKLFIKSALRLKKKK